MSHLNRTETASTIRHTVRINSRAESPARASRASSITSEKMRNRTSEIPPPPPADANSSGRWIRVFKRPWKMPQFLQWIPANFTWERLKPVIRCAIAGWIAVVLFVIPAVSNLMGQVSVVDDRVVVRAGFLMNLAYG